MMMDTGDCLRHRRHSAEPEPIFVVSARWASVNYREGEIEMATVIYGVDSAGSESTTHFPTKAEAMRDARQQAASCSRFYEIEVRRYTVAEGIPKRELYCRLLNGHWAAEIETIASITGTMADEE